jgi:hypothetical protein
LLNLTVPLGELFDILLSFKVQLNLELFMAIIIIMVGAYGWLGMILSLEVYIQLRIQAAKERFKSEFALVILRAKQRSKQAMSLWLQSAI